MTKDQTFVHFLPEVYREVVGALNVGGVDIESLAVRSVTVALLDGRLTHIQDVTSECHHLEVTHLVKLIHMYSNSNTYKDEDITISAGIYLRK